MEIKYKDLDKHFTLPKKQINPFYPSNVRIPRKLKKKVKAFCGIHFDSLNNCERLWNYMEYQNKYYKKFLIKQTVN